MVMKSMMKVMTRRNKSPYKPKDWLHFEDPRVEAVEQTSEFVQRVGALHIEEPFRQKEWWETNPDE